jgi:hypothetical protein
MKRFLFLISVVALSYPVYSQQYNVAVGFKGDLTTHDVASAQLSLKYFFSAPHAIEVNLGGGRQHIWLQTLYQRNYILSKDLDWYWGVGPDAGYWDRGSGGRSDVPEDKGFWVGVNGTFGMEYTFNVIPINLAIDTGPSLRLMPEVDFGWMAGFAIRYAFR